jgi:hypothetical protein
MEAVEMKRLKRFLIPGTVAALAAALILPAAAGARNDYGGGPMSGPVGPLADLHSDIAVLRTLRALNITQEQATRLAELSKEAQTIREEGRARMEEMASTLEGPLNQVKQDLLAGRQPSPDLMDSMQKSREKCQQAREANFEKMKDLADQLHQLFTEDQLKGLHDSYRMMGDRMRERMRDRMGQRDNRGSDRAQFRNRMEERKGEYKGSRTCNGMKGMSGLGPGMGFYGCGGPGFGGHGEHGFGLMGLLFHHNLPSLLASMQFPAK